MTTSQLPSSSLLMTTIPQTFKYLGIASLLVFGWEHLARKYNTTIKPSKAVNYTATSVNYIALKSTQSWKSAQKFMGSQWTRFNSFLWTRVYTFVNMLEGNEFQ